MRMDISLVRFIRVAGGTFRLWTYPDNPPRLPPDFQMIEMFFKPASHWPASRALIGQYGPDWAIRGGGTGVNFTHYITLHITQLLKGKFFFSSESLLC
jgi:hypothetical protein